MKIRYIILALFLIGGKALIAQIDLAPKFIDSLVQNAKELVRVEKIKIRINSLTEGVYSYRKVVSILNNSSTANTIYVAYDPETPVTQTNLASGILTSIFFKLCSVAPLMIKNFEF